jgi:hypothetical protein
MGQGALPGDTLLVGAVRPQEERAGERDKPCCEEGIARGEQAGDKPILAPRVRADEIDAPDQQCREEGEAPLEADACW